MHIWGVPQSFPPSSSELSLFFLFSSFPGSPLLSLECLPAAARKPTSSLSLPGSAAPLNSNKLFAFHLASVCSEDISLSISPATLKICHYDGIAAWLLRFLTALLLSSFFFFFLFPATAEKQK